MLRILLFALTSVLPTCAFGAFVITDANVDNTVRNSVIPPRKFNLVASEVNGASQLVVLDASTRLPAVNGSLLTSVIASSITAPNVQPGAFPAGSWSFSGQSTVTLTSNGTLCLNVDGGTLATDCQGNSVGVGTTLPSYPLHVAGAAYATGQGIFGGSVTVQGNTFSVGASTFVVSGGQTSFGTTTPAGSAIVTSSGVTVIASTSSALDHELLVIRNNAARRLFAFREDGRLIIGTGPVIGTLISAYSAGALSAGIAFVQSSFNSSNGWSLEEESDGTFKLDDNIGVLTRMLYTSGADGRLSLGRAGVDPTPDSTLELIPNPNDPSILRVSSQNASTDLFIVDRLGNAGILTTSPSYPLHVTGAGYFTGQAIVGGTLTVQGAGGLNTLQINGMTTALSVGQGGTGATTLASNGVLLGNGTSAISATTAGTANQVLRVPGAGGASAFGSVDIAQSAAVTGLLGVVNGGSGANLSATGGANQFVKQTSAGGVLTVAVIGSGELPADGYAATYVNTSGDTMTGNLSMGGANLTANGNFTLGQTSSNTFTMTGGSVTYTASYGLWIATATNADRPAFFLNSNGNVGIGAVSAGSRLVVSSLSNTLVQIDAPSASASALRFIKDGSSVQWDVNSPGSSSDLRFSDGTDRVTFKASTGRVGIGTTVPSYPLQVSGDAYATGQGIVGGSVTVQGTALSVNTKDLAVASGNVGVGDATPDGQLEIESTVGPTASIVLISSQDTSVLFRVRGDGLTAIGGATPDDALDVGGNVDMTGSLKFDNVAAASSATIHFAGGGNAEGITTPLTYGTTFWQTPPIQSAVTLVSLTACIHGAGSGGSTTWHCGTGDGGVRVTVAASAAGCTAGAASRVNVSLGSTISCRYEGSDTTRPTGNVIFQYLMQ